VPDPDQYVRLLSRADEPALSQLRLREYSSAPEFEMLRPEFLGWTEHDDDGVILGVWSQGVLVSTLRGIVVRDREGAEEVFTCTVDLPENKFPALLLGRGATAASCRRMGLNALLRLYFLRAAVETAGNPVRSSLALPYEGASRVGLMRKLGYELSLPAENWDPEARGLRPALLAVLSQEKFAGAIDVLNTVGGPNLERYSWLGVPLTLPAPLRIVRHEAAKAAQEG
jgi:hypothetical protein